MLGSRKSPDKTPRRELIKERKKKLDQWALARDKAKSNVSEYKT